MTGPYTVHIHVCVKYGPLYGHRTPFSPTTSVTTVPFTGAWVVLSEKILDRYNIPSQLHEHEAPDCFAEIGSLLIDYQSW